MERGAPSEVKREPPGLSLGGDDRGLGVKGEHQMEEPRKKDPKKITAR